LASLLSGVRLEEYVYEKVQGRRPVSQLDESLLGQFMVQAGNQFDAGTPYGKSTCRLAERRYGLQNYIKIQCRCGQLKSLIIGF